jgi:DNA polymerase III gamma/tau subunit
MENNMNNMYSMMITGIIHKMRSQLDEMETMARYMEKMERMNKETTCCSTSEGCEGDFNLLTHRFNILERRLAAVEESKNIYVQQENDAWLVGEEGSPVGNEVVELESTEDSAVSVVVKKADEEAAAKKRVEEEAAAKKKAEEEAAAKKKAEEEAVTKRKAEEEAAAKRKAEEEAAAKKADEQAAKKRADELAAKKKAEEEEARRKAEEEQEEEEEEVEEEEEEEATELMEFEYKGNTYYRDGDNVVYVLSEEGEPEPVGRFNEKTGGVKMFAK